MKLISTSQLWLTLEVHNPQGKLVKRIHKPARSYLLQWNQILQAVMAGRDTVAPANVTIKDTGGTSRTFAIPTWGLAILAITADENYGIQVGTGITAPANNDNKLQTQIGVAQLLNYQATTFTAAAIVGANVDLIFTRTFTNASGGTITVNEVGMAGNSRDTTSTVRNLLYTHDLATIAVGNLQTLTVTYTLRTTV